MNKVAEYFGMIRVKVSISFSSLEIGTINIVTHLLIKKLIELMKYYAFLFLMGIL